jgi:acetyl-CoA acetyltransferase
MGSFNGVFGPEPISSQRSCTPWTQEGLGRGLASLCIGGGEALALVVERDA